MELKVTFSRVVGSSLVAPSFEKWQTWENVKVSYKISRVMSRVAPTPRTDETVSFPATEEKIAFSMFECVIYTTTSSVVRVW